MAQRERLTPALLMTGTVALTVSIIVACSGDNPAGPQAPDAAGTGGDGKVTAACPGCFPAPAPVPGGNPAPVPVPGAPGAPTGGPTPNPSASPSPGSSASPSPTPSGSPSACPPSVTFTSSAPVAIGGSGLTLPIDVATYGTNCVVDRIQVSLHAATGGPAIAGNPSPAPPRLSIGVCGTGVGFNGCSSSTVYAFPTPAFLPSPSPTPTPDPSASPVASPTPTPSPTATPSPETVSVGTRLGTSCFDLVFDEGSANAFAPYDNPAPPYSGTYAIQGTGGALDDWHVTNDWELRFSGGPPELELQCVRVIFFTKTVTTTP